MVSGTLTGVDAVLGGLLEMASRVDNTVHESLYALRNLRVEDASQVFLRESSIREREVELDEAVVKFLTHGPTRETNLRLLISTLPLTNDLKRLGALAVTISGRVVSLQRHKPLMPPRELKLMGDTIGEKVSLVLQDLSGRRQVSDRMDLEKEELR